MKVRTSENMIYTFILFLILFLMNTMVNSIGDLDKERCEMVGGCKKYLIAGEDNPKLPASYIIQSTTKFMFLMVLLFSLIYLEVWLARGGIKKVYKFIREQT